MSNDGDVIDQVFCYGTLLPGQERWSFLAPFVMEYEPDQANGRIYDTTLGFPAAIFSQIGVIEGFRFRLDTLRLSEALKIIDEVESGVEGHYHRVAITTAMGELVYAYEYGGDAANLVPIPGGNWLTR